MTVCFIGHRTVDNAEQVKAKLLDALSTLIKNGADTFLFGSKSDFDTLCWEVVTSLKGQFPHLKRVCYTAPHEAAFTSIEERENFGCIRSTANGPVPQHRPCFRHVRTYRAFFPSFTICRSAVTASSTCSLRLNAEKLNRTVPVSAVPAD